ncbi:MAG TPA: site-specific integrase [Vicinamibacterales bacterium]|nr:site-specific integrase [Vicinamibacterales bacterium]
MSVRLTPYEGGRWEVDVRVRLASGAKHREKKVLAVSKTNAKRWGEERERHLLLNGPEATKKEVPTLAEFKDRFLDDYCRANRQKPSGISNKEIVLRVHLLPSLGSKRLDSITNADIQALKGRMTEASPKTVNNVLTCVSKLLKVATEWGVIEHMPCTIKLLKSGEGRMTFWGFDEYDRLVKAASVIDSSTCVAVLLGGDAGLRAGEIRALAWSDIDFKARKLFVSRSEWQGQVGTTKGDRMRTVPMTARLVEMLRKHRHLQSERVLCMLDGKPVVANTLAYWVERAARAAGLAATRKPKGAGPHVLRHTFCSHLAMRGASPKAIQDLAGHRDLATTQRYMHLSPSALEAAIALLDQPSPHSHWGAGGEAAPAQAAK